MIVVDASVVANALGDDGPHGAAARAALLEGHELATPDLVDVETVAVLRKRWLAGDLAARRFRAAIDDLTDLPMTRHPSLPFMVRAYGLRANVTPYDACYIGLAEALQCPLVTTDVRLASAPGPRCEIQLIRA